jgi:cytochrome c
LRGMAVGKKPTAGCLDSERIDAAMSNRRPAMKTLICAILAAAALAPAGQACADEYATADEAVALVHKVVLKIKTAGQDSVIAEINAFNPEFKDRDLYVTIMDMHGLELAHGANKKMQGVNLTDLKDKDGKYYIRERLEMIKSKDKIWQDYYFVNPVNKEIELKSMYCEKDVNVMVCSGVYKKK